MVYEGPGLAARIARGLERLAARDGFAKVSDAVGTAGSGSGIIPAGLAQPGPSRHCRAPEQTTPCCLQPAHHPPPVAARGAGGTLLRRPARTRKAARGPYEEGN